MPIDLDRVRAEAFFLYAETHLPNEAERAATLAALQLCADGTGRATPSVATYVFRRSAPAQRIGARVYETCVSTESTELYLSNAGFRDHIDTDEFRQGLRTLYKGTQRLGARIFWVGARPPADMLRNIYKSDPNARPLAAFRSTLFDSDIYAAARAQDVAILSLHCPVQAGRGAELVAATDALADAAQPISFVAFFHPLDQDSLRVFFVAPLAAPGQVGVIAERIGALAEAAGAPLLGHAQTHKDNPALAAALAHALAKTAGEWAVSATDYSGYIIHPAIET